jgi:hypothetical protein
MPALPPAHSIDACDDRRCRCFRLAARILPDRRRTELPPTPQTAIAPPARKLRAVLANYGHLKRRAEESVNLIAGPDVSPTVTPQPMATGRKALAIAFLLAMTLLIAPRGANAASVNLLNNGDFTHGSGSSCDGWRVDAWILAPTATEFIWIRPVGKEPGELEVDTHHDNDARWEQTVALDPGWYYFSVEARTEKILPFFIGATISVLEDSIMSADLKRTNGWTKLGFYLRVGPKGGDVDVALRIGGFMNLNRGKAFFRHASVVQVSGPPPGEKHVFDLEQIRKDEVVGPIGQTWSLVATFIGFILIAIFGWTLFSEDRPPDPYS